MYVEVGLTLIGIVSVRIIGEEKTYGVLKELWVSRFMQTDVFGSVLIAWIYIK